MKKRENTLLLRLAFKKRFDNLSSEIESDYTK